MSEDFFKKRIQFVAQNLVVVFLTLLNMKDHLRICEVTQEAYKYSNP